MKWKQQRFEPLEITSKFCSALLVVGLVLLGDVSRLWAQDFRVSHIAVSDTAVSLDFEGSSRSYYILYRGHQVTEISSLTAMILGESRDPQTGFVKLADLAPSSFTSFYRVERISTSQPRDSDADGIDDVYELRHPTFLNPLNPNDSLLDYDGDLLTNLQEYRFGSDPTVVAAVLTTVTSSPFPGETSVAVTRETILHFSATLAANTTISNSQLFATFAGRRLLSRIELSSDRRKATLFYLENLPGSARVRVTFDANTVLDARGNAVDADGNGQPGGVLLLDFDTQSQTIFPNTIVCGRVFASELAMRTNGNTNLSVNIPLAGVIVTADGLEEQVRAMSDAFGNFRLTNAPAGPFFVHIDGRTVRDDPKGIRYPDRAYFPFVGKLWHSVPGGETNIGEVYLPLVADGTLQPVSLTNDTVITLPDSVLAEHPELAGLSLTVPANSLFSDNGTRGGLVGIAPVPPDRLPSALPPGLDFPLVITVQSDGPANFDTPAPICFPNLRRLPPGTKSALWSFNHDLGEFEIVGPMTVSADGRLVCTDPGVGVPTPGWGGDNPACGNGGDDGGGGDPPDDEPPKDDPGECEDDPTDPVYLFSGEFYHEETDLLIKGVGMDFVWTRKYRSKLGPNTVQGNGWDFSHNLTVTQSGTSISVCNGRGRDDLYQAMPDGTWAFNGFFRELKKNADATHTLTFKDRAAWNFQPFDSSLQAGKVTSIADRNGNTLQYVYDAQGRLIRVIDTLDRTITISHNADGFIASITDFAGRTVRYTYYGNNEPGGNFGDLKSVTTPPVTGTPNGNDFPKGKTRTYTYTTGFDDDRLNHNLLTITDGRRNDPDDPTFGSGPYLVNEYSTTTNPEDTNFDRVVRQIWGGQPIHLTYVPQVPAAENAQAAMRTIVKDRVGNVKEYFYDVGNRCVMMREYTGRADPAKPSTDLANRPRGKLRSTDPDYFETRYEYNLDYQRTRTIHPNGNTTENVYEADINPTAPARFRGNLRIVRHLPGTHTPVGDQETITETYEYATDFGGICCGFSFVTKQTAGRGNATTYDYDALGNRIRIQYPIASIVEEFEYDSQGRMTKRTLPDNGSGSRRTDVFNYYTSGPQRGYLQKEIIDAANFALTTTYEYDAVGNVIRKTDPRGHDTQWVVNALNQIVREISREVTDGSGIRYQKDTFYDANNNVVRVDVQNRDETRALQPNTHFTTRYDYEVLNHVIRESREVESNQFAVTEFAYDGNRNRVLVRLGEAVNGHQPANTFTTFFDERDLIFQIVRAAGDPAKATTQYDYDGNRNRTTSSEGLEDRPHVTENTYDGYNRLVQSTDPMGNLRSHRYDANGKRTGERVDGELDDQPGGANNVRLSETTYTYDALNRLTVKEAAFFDTQTQAPIGDGIARTATVYADASQGLRTIDDNGHETRTEYDTANRRRLTTDVKGNTVTHEYDANSNLILMTETELSDLGNPDQVFFTRLEYDNLNRMITARDNVANTTRFAYDSRNNRTLSSDARGNVTHFVYDGLNRLLASVREMTDTGDGSGSVVGTITTSQRWDDNSRLIAQVDDNGNATTYVYDALNRQTATIFADGTAQTSVLNVHGNAVRMSDGNSNVVLGTYDLLNRVIRKDITPGPGVSDDTTFEDYTYDGLGRGAHLEDDDSLVRRTYDSLSHTTSETLTIAKGSLSESSGTTSSPFDGVGNELTCVYPGGRTVTCTFDERNRKKTVSDASGNITTYYYVGPGRVERKNLGNGTRCDFTYDGITGVPNSANDFGVKRIVRTRHTMAATGAVLDDRTFAWDPAHNKTQRKDIRAGGPGLIHDYSYDSAARMIRSAKSDAGGMLDTISYNLDGVGNRQTVSGGPDLGDYTMDASALEPADRQVNQYTTTPFDSRINDRNGNLAGIDAGLPTQRLLRFDYRNRLVRIDDTAAGVHHDYLYDALGRRIAKVVNVGATPEETRFWHVRWQVVEETDAVRATKATYVWGIYIDEMLQMQRGTTGTYALADDQSTVVGLSDSLGAVVERYEYADFGTPWVTDAAGSPLPRSLAGNPNLFTGRRFDSESRFYDYRNRLVDPRAGRFLTRDPLGTWGDRINLGSALSYTGNNPLSRQDPLGLDAVDCAVSATMALDVCKWFADIDHCWDDSGNDIPCDSGYYAATQKCYDAFKAELKKCRESLEAGECPPDDTSPPVLSPWEPTPVLSPWNPASPDHNCIGPFAIPALCL